MTSKLIDGGAIGGIMIHHTNIIEKNNNLNLKIQTLKIRIHSWPMASNGSMAVLLVVPRVAHTKKGTLPALRSS